MFTILSPMYANNICHRILGFVFLCSLAREVSSTVLWPAGKYGLPKPKSGCPESNGFNWNSGYTFQDLEDTNCLTKASPNIHLDGWVQGDVLQYYCIKNNASAAVDSKRSRWPAGEYCIYQKGTNCPAGLQSGSVLWDDENHSGGIIGKNRNMHAGVLPEGVYNKDTKIFFCCTGTGSRYDPIKLPVSSPFYLMAFASQCQEVLNTVHTMEYITYDTENVNNTDWRTSPYPYGADQVNPGPTINYCYYKECAWTLTALSGSFWSPYYPQDYHNRHSCKWRINVPWNYTISVTFEDVTLERRCCQCDYVELWETLPNGATVFMGKFCDETKPAPSYQFRSTGNNMTVLFFSDARVQAKGFKASYKAIPVPATTTNHPVIGSIANGISTRTSTMKYVTTTAATTTSTVASTANNNGTKPSTTKPSYVTTTASTTSKETTVVTEQNGLTTTAPFTHMPTGTPQYTTGRETTSVSSSFTKETFTTEFTSDQRISATEPGITTERGDVREARKESASTGSAFIIGGVIGSLIVIGGALAGTLFWFCKRRNSKKNNNRKRKLGMSFTSYASDKAFGMSNISSWDMYQGRGVVSNEENANEDYAKLERKYDTCIEPIKESDNPMYGRDCLVTAVTFGYNDVVKKSDNPIYVRDSLVVSVKAQYTDMGKGSENPAYENTEPIKESDNPIYGRDCLVTAVTFGYNDEVKTSDNPMYVRDSPVVSVKTQFTDMGKGSENPAYENDYQETSPKKGYEDELKQSENPLYGSSLETVKQSENPLYASSLETVKQSENPLYESMDDKSKGTADDGIYSSLYERMG